MRILKFQYLSMLALVMGCSLAPDYQRPEVPLPGKFSEEHQAGASIADVKWLDVFRDVSLKAVIEEALNNNRDLSVALSRIEEAKSLVRFTRADQFPFINVKSGISRGDLGSDSSLGDSFNVLGDLTFEVDLWGKLRNATQSQRAILLSSAYAYQTLTASLISQVADLYFTLIDLDQRILISRETVKNRRTAKGIISERLNQGIVSELELNQAQIEEMSVNITLIGFERDRQIVEHALLVLLGRNSGGIQRADSLRNAEILTSMPAEVPAKILEKRPDLLSIEENIKSQLYLEGVTEAQRLPSIQILGTLGFGSINSTDIYSSDASSWSIGGNLFSPLLNLNKNESRVDAQKARVEQAKKSYESAVIKAVQEVQDALVEIQTYDQEFKQRQGQVSVSKNANMLTRARYDNGVASYVEVLDIERSRYNAELGASIANRRYLSSLVKLYRSLGGGWEMREF